MKSRVSALIYSIFTFVVVRSRSEELRRISDDMKSSMTLKRLYFSLKYLFLLMEMLQTH